VPDPRCETCRLPGFHTLELGEQRFLWELPGLPGENALIFGKNHPEER